MKNIKYFAHCYLNGKLVKTRTFATEKAKDNFCNKWGAKNLDGVIEVCDADTMERVETWAS